MEAKNSHPRSGQAKSLGRGLRRGVVVIVWGHVGRGRSGVALGTDQGCVCLSSPFIVVLGPGAEHTSRSDCHLRLLFSGAVFLRR